MPRHIAFDSIAAVLIMALALRETVRLARSLRAVDRRPDDWVILSMLMTISLPLCEVMIDTYLILDRRVSPYDHLISYLGAKRLAVGLEMPPDMSLRPWLLHVLFAPLSSLSGTFSYWCYLGFMAAFNTLVLVPAALLVRRWHGHTGQESVRLIAIMPILVCFHFPGQRPMTAAFALLAVYWWTSTAARSWLWGGVAISIAVMTHPSALFVLPGAMAYWLFSGPWPRSFFVVARCLVLPALTYGAWLVFVARTFPGVRNDLIYYPLMLRLDQPFDSTLSVVQILQSVSAEHWAQLGMNRLFQLRHYLWTNNPRHPWVDFFRYISFPNIFGFALTLGLLSSSVWRRDKAFLWLAVIAPLLLHHVHIGAASPGFHISPTPFFAIATLLVQHYGRGTDRFAQVLVKVALVEWFLRQLYPVMLTDLFPPGEGSIFSADQTSYHVMACCLPAAWLFAAWVMCPSDSYGRRPTSPVANSTNRLPSRPK